MVAWLKSQNTDYFVVEAIDQPWKSTILEGKAGGYGVSGTPTVSRSSPGTGLDRTIPAMVGMRCLDAGMALPLMLVFLWRWPDLGAAGQWAFAVWQRWWRAPWCTVHRLAAGT